MLVKIISETCQEYNGNKYYRCGNYFQRDGVRLHRKIWEDFVGNIPEGFHIHHKDHDRANNQIENLTLLLATEHIRDHHLGHTRSISVNALEAAALWHQSESGRDWHKIHYANVADKLHKRKEMICPQCKNTFNGLDNNRSHFCSNKCKTRHRFLSGVDNEKRNCAECGVSFDINKYVKTMSCSRRCGIKLAKKIRKT